MEKLPRRVTVRELRSGRYNGARPRSWDLRVPGDDQILTSDGEALTLSSTGQQSSPQPGWDLLLLGKEPSGSYRWTLYGMKSNFSHSDTLEL